MYLYWCIFDILSCKAAMYLWYHTPFCKRKLDQINIPV